MDTLFIPNETDFRKWIQEAVKAGMETAASNNAAEKEEPLISRKQVAAFLGISLVTLTDWMKRGLPFHKVNGRVYFQRSEVLEYVKTNHGRRQSIYFKY
jgi:predicted DNA-binding transcriptional regulator AlpA